MVVTSGVPPTVFVSYSQADPEHAKKVYTLVSLLKSKGVNVTLDSEKPYDVSWPDWIINRGFARGTKVVVAGDPYYVKNSEKRDPSNLDKGLGVWNEWRYIENRIYDRQNQENWLVSIFFKGGSQRTHLPESLCAWTYYEIDPANDKDSGFVDFYRCINDVPSFSCGPVNPIFTPPEPTTVFTPGSSSQEYFYKIQPGEDCWKLELKYRWPEGSIQPLNPGLDVNNIPCYYNLRVPGKVDPQPGGSGVAGRDEPRGSTPTEFFYQIQPGEYAYLLEQRYGWPGGSIARLNPDLNLNNIPAYHTLRVPGPVNS